MINILSFHMQQLKSFLSCKYIFTPYYVRYENETCYDIYYYETMTFNLLIFQLTDTAFLTV